MPLYLYSCPTCARKREVLKPIAQLDDPVHCLNCQGAMNRQLTAPMVRGDLPGYECPVTGAWIEGRRAHQENLAKHGCRVLEPGETAEVSRARARADAELDRSVDESVDRFIAELPTDKRDRLAAEVEGGMTAEIVRTSID